MESLYSFVVRYADLIAGVLLSGCALAQTFTIKRAYRDKAVKGVHPGMIWYFTALNAYFVWFFWMREAWFPVIGEVAIVLTDLVWISQYYYYTYLRVRQAKDY